MKFILLAPFVLAALGFTVLVVLIAYRRAWRIPAPNEALIIVGKGRGRGCGPVVPDDLEADAVQAITEQRTEGLDFRIATTATWVNPVTARVFRLPWTRVRRHSRSSATTPRRSPSGSRA